MNTFPQKEPIVGMFPPEDNQSQIIQQIMRAHRDPDFSNQFIRQNRKQVTLLRYVAIFIPILIINMLFWRAKKYHS